MKKQKCDIKAKEQQLRACLGMMNFTMFASLLLCHLNCFFYSLEISYFKKKKKFHKQSSRNSFCSECSEHFIDSPVERKTNKRNNKVVALFYQTISYFSSLTGAQIFNMVSLPISLAQTWLLFSIAALSARIGQGRSHDLITEPTFTF